MDISKILKELRLEANLTQSELAKNLQIGQSTIVDYEKGEREATLTNLCRYATYFDVSLDFLAGRENDYGVKVVTPTGDVLSSEERQIIEQYRSLPEKLKKLVQEQLDVYCAPSELLPKTNKKV